MGNDLELEEEPKAKIHLDSHRVTLKKVTKWQMPAHDGIYGYWFKNSLLSMTD